MATDVDPVLVAAFDRVYGHGGLHYRSLAAEVESADYGACRFEVNGLAVQFRAAKITPKKIGQFVTLWKRAGTGPIQPFDTADPVDCFIVAASCGARSGHFIFAKSVLAARGVISVDGIGGRRAMRIYAPWDAPDSKQALKTQAWQSEYFIDTGNGRDTDHARVKTLLGIS